jgi:hypothetical protein
LAGKANGLLRFNVDVKQGMVAGGTLAQSYLNRFGLGGATELKIRQHPFITPGTILMTTSQLPYALSNVEQRVPDPDAAGLLPDRVALALAQVRVRRLRRRSAAALLPALDGVITGIGNG